MFFEIKQDNNESDDNAKDVNKYCLNLVIQEELVVKEIIGYGAFGTVHKGYYVPSTDPHKKIKVAIKIMKPSKRTDEKTLREIANDLMNVNTIYNYNLCSLSLLLFFMTKNKRKPK